MTLIFLVLTSIAMFVVALFLFILGVINLLAWIATGFSNGRLLQFLTFWLLSTLITFAAIANLIHL